MQIGGMDALGSDKGKPVERQGRKAPGLRPHQADMTAGLPKSRLPGQVLGRSALVVPGKLTTEATKRRSG